MALAALETVAEWSVERVAAAVEPLTAAVVEGATVKGLRVGTQPRASHLVGPRLPVGSPAAVVQGLAEAQVHVSLCGESLRRELGFPPRDLVSRPDLLRTPPDDPVSVCPVCSSACVGVRLRSPSSRGSCAWDSRQQGDGVMDVEGFFDDTCGFSDRGSALARRAHRTLMFGPQQVGFVKLDVVPAVQRGRPPRDSVRRLAVGGRLNPPEATR